ncbi:hypothetical protein V6N13_033745 [Hibiscus sabdariffa]|uniref:Uncharacterized protein n=1 Tax=Hibiscus sabdariffa TaxID=183260 RepID=A0ABR2F9R3_9ROSI
MTENPSVTAQTSAGNHGGRPPDGPTSRVGSTTFGGLGLPTAEIPTSVAVTLVVEGYGKIVVQDDNLGCDSHVAMDVQHVSDVLDGYCVEEAWQITMADRGRKSMPRWLLGLRVRMVVTKW